MAAMHPGEWTRELEAAVSEKDVAQVVREYGARLSSAEIAKLPATCRPPLVRDAEDISSWGIEALRCKLAICPDTDHVALILALEAFLSAAMHRLARIEALAADPLVDVPPRRLDS